MEPNGLTMVASEDAELPNVVEGYGTASSGSNLVGMVMRDFQVDSAARLFQEQQVFLRALFNSRAYYLPDLNFPTNTSKAFVNATRPKIQTAVALLMPILCPPGDEAWTIDPDPDTVDPAHALLLLEQKVPMDQIRDAMFQAAGAKADRLNQKISKGMHFARFSDKTVRFLFDLCLFGSGIMMGAMPVPNPEAYPPNSPESGSSLWDVMAGFDGTTAKKKIKKGYDKLIDCGLLDEVMPNMSVISPLDFYPDSAAYSIEQARRCTYRMVLGKGQVMEMLDDPTFRKEDVQKVLTNYPNGVYSPTYWETAVNSLNKQPNQIVPNGRYVCFQWWGWLTGKDLHNAGALKIPEERFHERVMAQVWVIGNHLVKVAVSELHENRLPFYVCPYSYAPNSIWGIGPAEMMFDSQDAINACERSIMDNMGLCLTGDTVVYRCQGKGRVRERSQNNKANTSITLRELWESKHQRNSGLRRNLIRSLDEATGEIFGNRIVDVLNNGFKEVWRITTEKGYTVKGTIDHRFYNDYGEYKHMGFFKPGDMIGVNGTYALREKICVDCGTGIKKPGALRCKSCAAKVSTWNVKQAELAITSIEGSANSARARKLVRIQMKSACEVCGLSDDLNIHHKDRDPWNNHPENLQTLCRWCHKDTHARHDHFGDALNHVYLDYDKVVSVEFVGVEEVFDLVMTAPNHNFIANGFVAHNCSGPQVIVDCSQLADPSSVLEIKPRRIWAVRGIAGVTTRPVEFFVPDCQLGQILTVQQNEERLAQEQTGLPNFLQGMNGAGTHNRTAEGANLQFNNSISSLKTVVYNIENNVIVPFINNMVRFYQIYSRDPQIQGNFRVNVHGVRGLLARESLISSVNDLLMAVGNMPSEAGRLKMSNVFKTYLRYGGFTNDDFVYSDSEYAEIQKAQQQQQRENQAFQGGMQASPKLRAETPPRDALLELVKSAPEGTAGAEALLQEAAQVWGFVTPQVQTAFDADNKMTQFRQVNEAHGLGSEMGDRGHAPVGNPLKDHPHLLPPNPTDQMQNKTQQQAQQVPPVPPSGGGK